MGLLMSTIHSFVLIWLFPIMILFDNSKRKAHGFYTVTHSFQSEHIIDISNYKVGKDCWMGEKSSGFHVKLKNNHYWGKLRMPLEDPVIRGDPRRLSPFCLRSIREGPTDQQWERDLPGPLLYWCFSFSFWWDPHVSWRYPTEFLIYSLNPPPGLLLLWWEPFGFQKQQ